MKTKHGFFGTTNLYLKDSKQIKTSLNTWSKENLTHICTQLPLNSSLADQTVFIHLRPVTGFTIFWTLVLTVAPTEASFVTALSKLLTPHSAPAQATLDTPTYCVTAQGGRAPRGALFFTAGTKVLGRTSDAVAALLFTRWATLGTRVFTGFSVKPVPALGACKLTFDLYTGLTVWKIKTTLCWLIPFIKFLCRLPFGFMNTCNGVWKCYIKNIIIFKYMNTPANCKFLLWLNTEIFLSLVNLHFSQVFYTNNCTVCFTCK